MLHFTEKLQEQLNTTVAKELLPNGVYRVYIDLDPTHIDVYVYPHYITSRIASDGISKIIHLDQDILEDEFEKVMVRIQVMAGLGIKVHARSTVAARIDKKRALEFQKEHHLQIALPGKYRYGLYHQGELVTIAVFSGGRKMRDKPEDYRSFELLRFCHKRNIITIGGISKLIGAFCKDFNPGDIMTYVDRDWSQDSTLKKVGFVPEKTTAPQTFILVSGKRMLYKKLNSNPAIPENTHQKRNSGSIKMVLSLYNPD